MNHATNGAALFLAIISARVIAVNAWPEVGSATPLWGFLEHCPRAALASVVVGEGLVPSRNLNSLPGSTGGHEGLPYGSRLARRLREPLPRPADKAMLMLVRILGKPLSCRGHPRLWPVGEASGSVRR